MTLIYPLTFPLVLKVLPLHLSTDVSIREAGLNVVQTFIVFRDFIQQNMLIPYLTLDRLPPYLGLSNFDVIQPLLLHHHWDRIVQ